MKTNVLIVVLMLNFLVKNCIVAQEQDVFDQEFILEVIKKVNSYQLANPHKEDDDNWIRGTYYAGVMACYQSTKIPALLDQCDTWGEKWNWQIPILKPEQKASGVNLLTCGQTWLQSYMINEKKYKIEPTITHLEDPSIRNPVSNPLYWYFEGGRRYVDGLFTGPPALAMLYKITKEENYLNWMDACVWDVYGALYDHNIGLFYRDIRFKKGYPGKVSDRYVRPDSVNYDEARTSYVYQETTKGKNVIWSRGNGWAFAGLVRILMYLPKDHANYERYQKVFVRMAEALKKCQQPDGFWYPNLEDPEDYGTKESSGTGFFTYGFAWGINNGILDSKDYLEVVEKSWPALASIVSKEGKVQWGQLVGACPYKILQEDSHEYVTGTFLLAASEVYKLKR